MALGVPLNGKLPLLRDSRIVGGKPAQPGQFPFQVSLRYLYSFDEIDEDYEDFCSGNIISERWILTAAHCFHAFNKNVTHLRAIAGIVDLDDTNGARYEIEIIAIHPEYNEFLIMNDIALVQTVDYFTFTDTIRPIKLSREHVAGGMQCMTSGWGLIKVR